MNILVTAIGSFSADCVIGTLKKAGHNVIGCDINPSVWLPVSKKCDAVYQAPYATEEKKYISFLRDVCKKDNIQLLFPLTDLEIDVLNRYRDVFKDINVTLCIQSEPCLSFARNKSVLTNLFEKDTFVNVPLSAYSRNITENFPLPAIAKPIHGRSSEGIIRISSLDQLIKLAKEENYIIQQYLEGNVYTVDYVRDEYGHDYSVPREELLRTKNGAGTTVRIDPNSKLQKMVSYIGNKLGIIGCVNMEFICNKSQFYLIDLNPRFSAGVAFSNFIGYDMVTSHLNCFLHMNILPKVEFKEQILAKHYQEELLWQRK